MAGFFQYLQLADALHIDSTVPKCGACGLFKGCKSPKMPVAGKGKKGILILAEAPGKQEDEDGVPLVGKAGQYLSGVLAKLGIEMRRDCWLTNALICRPEGNRTPDIKEIGYCRPNVIRALKELEPEKVLVFGGPAVKSIIPHAWETTGDVGGIGRWVGWRIPSRKLNAWLCPTFHPSYLLRSHDRILDRMFEKHLKAALELEGRPWEKVDDLRREVVVTAPADAAVLIETWLKAGEGRLAFDYETNMLKPDSSDARIVSCSVCWGHGDWTRTIVFPWRGLAVAAVSKMLKSDVPKIASNLKFEERWTRAILGHGVNNWCWDTMQAAHVLDNRPEIASIKFQAFVRLGVTAYDNHIKPYLQADGGHTPNRIHEVPLDKLLLYNGLDSLLEYKVAALQMEEMGHANERKEERRSAL